MSAQAADGRMINDGLAKLGKLLTAERMWFTGWTNDTNLERVQQQLLYLRWKALPADYAVGNRKHDG